MENYHTSYEMWPEIYLTRWLSRQQHCLAFDFRQPPPWPLLKLPSDLPVAVFTSLSASYNAQPFMTGSSFAVVTRKLVRSEDFRWLPRTPAVATSGGLTPVAGDFLCGRLSLLISLDLPWSRIHEPVALYWTGSRVCLCEEENGVRDFTSPVALHYYY